MILPLKEAIKIKINVQYKNVALQCDQSSQAKVGGADPPKKFIGKNSKTP